MLVLALCKEDYLQILNGCPFDSTAFVVSGKVGYLLTGLTTPVGWVSLPQLTVHRCVIEVFGGVCVLPCCVWGFSVGIGAFVIGLSRISFFFASFIIHHCNELILASVIHYLDRFV